MLEIRRLPRQVTFILMVASLCLVESCSSGPSYKVLAANPENWKGQRFRWKGTIMGEVKAGAKSVLVKLDQGYAASVTLKEPSSIAIAPDSSVTVEGILSTLRMSVGFTSSTGTPEGTAKVISLDEGTFTVD